MKRYTLHTPFNIYHFETSHWEHPLHNHTYFEIIFILKGKGRHQINGNVVDYKQGDVFLIGPEDVHHFEIQASSEFCFIRFNNYFHSHDIAKKKGYDRENIWSRLLHTSSKSRGSMVYGELEKQKLHRLLSVLEQEYESNQSPYFEAIRDSLMQSMLTILARNLLGKDHTKTTKKNAAEAILIYVQRYIHEPSKLNTGHLAQKFHYAPEYIGIFFKKHTGQSLKKYIVQHRIKRIEARLIYSKLTLADIADEFGYTDESHFCKQFKKYTGITPSSFRKGV